MGTSQRLFGTGIWILLGSAAWAQVTQRVSVSTTGTQASGHSYQPAISADGRFVAFWSFANDLVPGDLLVLDVFVRDRQGGATECVSVSTGGSAGNDHSYVPWISADGRYVGFTSDASNLVAGDTNGQPDVFVRDRLTATTERVSVASSGGQGNGDSFGGSISADGRYVVFHSRAANLAPGDTNQTADCFLRDRQIGITELVSAAPGGAPGNNESGNCTISADGRYVAYVSGASDLVAGDANGVADVFVRDRLAGTTELVSLDSNGVQADTNSDFGIAISPDGRYVVFNSRATNLVPGDTNQRYDAFLRDRQAGTTERISVDSSGGQFAEDSGIGPGAISADGRRVGFKSNGVFLRDRQTGTTQLLSVDSSGVPANDDSGGAVLSADGLLVAFQSDATNLVPWDTNARTDVFVRDTTGGPAFTSLCEPGSGGVIACPCSNPPAGPGRGCDNSSGTGGAVLAASGGTYLSSDSMVFTTSGEIAAALSILVQGNLRSSSGVPYGQGVRCVRGSLLRLFVKSAIGGGITAPDFPAGDPSVSTRSAAKGDPIQPGQSRWYYVYYRSPTVLGGCPATSTFNATQAGQLTWSP